jgi:hypothetical protein
MEVSFLLSNWEGKFGYWQESAFDFAMLLMSSRCPSKLSG